MGASRGQPHITPIQRLEMVLGGAQNRPILTTEWRTGMFGSAPRSSCPCQKGSNSNHKLLHSISSRKKLGVSDSLPGTPPPRTDMFEGGGTRVSRSKSVPTPSPSWADLTTFSAPPPAPDPLAGPRHVWGRPGVNFASATTPQGANHPHGSPLEG